MRNANRLTLLSGVALMVAAFAWPTRASAHDHFDLSVGFGGPAYVTPAPVVVAQAPDVERRWVPGHYETRVSTVLVDSGRHEREWVPPVTHVRLDPYGYRYSVTSPGYYRDVVLPARYENRETRVWVEGYYQDVAVAPPAVVYHRPGFNIGGFFRF